MYQIRINLKITGFLENYFLKYFFGSDMGLLVSIHIFFSNDTALSPPKVDQYVVF